MEIRELLIDYLDAHENNSHQERLETGRSMPPEAVAAIEKASDDNPAALTK